MSVKTNKSKVSLKIIYWHFDVDTEILSTLLFWHPRIENVGESKRDIHVK